MVFLVRLAQLFGQSAHISIIIEYLSAPLTCNFICAADNVSWCSLKQHGFNHPGILPGICQQVWCSSQVNEYHKLG